LVSAVFENYRVEARTANNQHVSTYILDNYLNGIKFNLRREIMRYILISLITFLCQPVFAQEMSIGLRGDSVAIADAEKMVEAMGGIEIWKHIKSLHFVHEWHPVNRADTYIENEILDLTSPRSWVNRKSEVTQTIRAYSPEGKYWTIKDGVFAYGSDNIWNAAIERAPFNFYHLVKAIAIKDSFYEIRYGKSDIPYTQQLNFYGPDGIIRGWVVLNAKMEPIVKATPEYRYTLGPLKRFGNLWVPNWGVYDNGYTRFEMISLVGDNQPPDSTLFLPPSEFKK